VKLAFLALTLAGCTVVNSNPNPPRDPYADLPECPGSVEVHATGTPCLLGHNENHEPCFWRCK